MNALPEQRLVAGGGGDAGRALTGDSRPREERMGTMNASRLATRLVAVVVLCGPPGLAPCRAQDLVISEFMAVNSGVITDEDGETSDWIEVHNPGVDRVDLGGWYLTDDPRDHEKWLFPALGLEGGEYLLIFASGKDRRNPAGELHTNFRLGGTGEYVALIRPDGTVAHSYTFPEQRPDLSYGIGEDLLIDRILSAGAPARVLIPRDSSLGTTWTGGNEPFDDASWLEGSTGVGYLISQPGFAVRTILAGGTVGSLDDAEDVLKIPGLQVKVTTANEGLVDFFNTGGSGHYPNDNPFPGTTAGTDENDFVVEVTGSVTIPTAGSWTFGVNSDDGFGLDLSGPGGSFRIEYITPRGPGDTLGIFNVATAGVHDLRLVFYERGGGSELELFARQGAYSSWDSGFRLVGDTAAGGLEVFSQPLSSGTSSSIRDFIETDLRDSMYEVNASAYLRIPFQVADPGAYDSLALRMKYDDGFIAYLNGVEVARRNAPITPRYNSLATADRPGAQAVSFQNIDISAHLGALRAGANVLALHGLNDNPGGHDFLVLPELAEITVKSMATGFFEVPTPGRPNAAAFLDFVADTKFSPDRGFYTDSFHVTITTKTEGAEIFYTTDGSWPGPENGFLYDGPIPVDATTTLRAVAIKPGLVPTNTDTHTYIFLNDVIYQTGAGFPASWAGNEADYEMDWRVVDDPAYAADIEQDLLSIPTMSIVMDLEDLFGDSRGIYSHSNSSGRSWERAGSVELILPEGVEIPGGGDGFKINCGVRIYGGVGRNPNYFKHSFRLLFKGEYGPTKLDYPLFANAIQLQDGGAVDKFDTVILRAGFNNSWIIGGGQSDQAQYLRDQFMRDTLLEMGQPDPHGIFVHLYLNGLYWGLYNLVERPSAPFCESYFGGSKNYWDALNSGEVLDGDRVAWDTMQSLAAAGLADDADYAAIQEYVDVPNLIDYMIVNFYGGNSDWDGHNWYAGRYRAPGEGYKFFSWDAERVLEGTGVNRIGLNNPDKPSGVFGPLGGNAEFRVLVGDHVHRHCFNDGALTPEATAARYRFRAEEIDRAIVGESARWGDRKRAAAYTRDIEWVQERDRLLNDYFPRRTGILVSQLRGAGLYPAVNAPVFNRHGGEVPGGFPLLITATDGAIYYTLDGSDPRLPGGGILPGALLAGTAKAERLVESGAPARVLVPLDGSLGLDWTQVGFDDSGWIPGATGVGFERSSGYETLIETDLGDLLYEKNGTCYIRIPFTLDDPAAVASLNLQMKYDDGFIAYLNGTKVAARNAPPSPLWNSLATVSHGDNEALVFETFNLDGYTGLLRAGVNVLAIHGLNITTNSSDLLLLPELEAAMATDGHGIIINSTTLVRARALSGGEWSALNEALFIVPADLRLRVTEIMYHPEAPDPGSLYGDEDLEFIELQNVGPGEISLLGVSIRGGIEFDFPPGQASLLQPGDYIVVVRNLEAFASRYQTAGVLIAGEYRRHLGNSGDDIWVRGPSGETILSFRFADTWYPSTDGAGFSLVAVDPLAPVEAWSDPESWRPSGQRGGSPGFDDDGPGPGGLQRPGDFNQDNLLDIADAMAYLARMYFSESPPLPCGEDSVFGEANLRVLDVNGDTGIDLSDVIHLLSYLFLGGSPPAAGDNCIRVPGCPEVCAP